MSTIKDVARRAGVGVGTASRALSGKGPVAAETLARVRAAATALDYRPSAIARALSLKRSDAVGLYLPVFDTGFYARILSSVDATLRAAGRHMVVVNGCGAGDPRQRALDAIRFLLARDCDGLIVASHHLRDADLRELHQRHRNIVVVNRVIPRMAAHCIGIDHTEGGRLAARTLLAHGHRQIVAVSGPHDAPDNEQRMSGFARELARHGLQVALKLDGQFTHASGAAAAEQLMARLDLRRPVEQRCSAVFCANDLMAVAVASRLQLAGWRVPEDLSIVGYDDTDIAPYATPPLTSVHVPIAEAARMACARVLQFCDGEVPSAPVGRTHRCAVVWRDSVCIGPCPPLGPGPRTQAAAPERGEYLRLD